MERIKYSGTEFQILQYDLQSNKLYMLYYEPGYVYVCVCLGLCLTKFTLAHFHIFVSHFELSKNHDFAFYIFTN